MGDTVGDTAREEDERKRAEVFYQRLLDVFPKRQNDNVVIFPGPAQSHQPAKTPQSAVLPLGGSSAWRPESRGAARPSRIEGLLKRLFEDLAKDD